MVKTRSELIGQLFWVIGICACLMCKGLYAHNDDTTKRGRALIVPILYFEPETKWAGGLGGICYYRFDTTTGNTRPSSFYFYAVYTLEKQTLFSLPFNIFSKNEQYFVFGEMNYYDFPIRYFGIGNDVDFTSYHQLEQRFTKIRIQATRKIGGEWYMGPNMRLDHYYQISAPKAAGLQELSIPGAAGGKSTGLGFTLLTDNREYVYAPQNALYARIGFTYYHRLMNEHQKAFANYRFDFRKYFATGSKSTIAAQFLGSFNTRNTPFYLYELMGGLYQQRGVYKGSLRDRHQMLFQMEWRHWPFRRFGYAVFGGLGQVFQSFKKWKIQHMHPTIGLGLRFMLNRKQRIPMRLDYGRSPGQEGWYITTGQAF